MERSRLLFLLLILSCPLVLSSELLGQMPRHPVQLDSGNPSSGAYDPSICADSGNVYVAWTDLRSGGHGVYFTGSDDNGSTFATEVRLDSDASDARKDLIPSSVYASGLDLYVFWFDQRNGADDIYFTASHDGGVSFAPELRIDDSELPGGADVKDALMAVSESNIYFAMNVEINNADEDVFLSISTDGGVSFSAAIHASRGSPGDFDVDTIGLACFGDAAFVAFDDNSGGNDDLFGRPFDNLGTLGSIVRIDTDSTGYGDVEDEIKVLMTSGDDVHVFWQEERLDPALANEELRYNRSTDGGVAFGTSDVLIGNYNAGTDDVDNPVGADSGSTLLLAWEDNRSGSNEVYLASSFDSGVTWNTDIQLSIGGASSPRIDFTGDMAGVAWAAPSVPDEAWVVWSRDGGISFGPMVNMSSSPGDVDRVEISVDATYQSCHVAFLDDVLQGFDSNNVFVNAFRSAGLIIQGNLVSGSPHMFQIDGAVAGESGGGNTFGVVLSNSLGFLPLPGDGRNVGLLYDQLFRTGLNYTSILSGAIDQNGAGSTSVFPLPLPPGTTFYAVGVVLFSGGGFGSVTDPIKVTVL